MDSTICSLEAANLRDLSKTDVWRVIVQQPTLPKYRAPIFEALSERAGVRLTVIDGREAAAPPPVAAPNLNVKIEPMRTFRLFGQQILWHRSQWAYARRDKADVLVLSWNVRYLSLIPALVRARFQGVPTILWGHGYSKTESGLRSWFRDRVARLATAILLYNHTAAKAYLERGWDPNRVHVALNALDQREIQASRQAWVSAPARLSQFRQSQGLGDGPVILFVSRLEEANRVDLLIAATAELRKRFADLKTVIIGKGASETTLKDQARKLGVDDCVKFLGAIYGEADLAPWFCVSTVFCYPANIGLSILHAFGYGLPVVTSDRIEAQNPEIEALRDRHNGMLYEADRVEALTASLDYLLTHPEEARRMGKNALKTVEQTFSLDCMVKGFVEAIRYAAGAGRTE